MDNSNGGPLTWESFDPMRDVNNDKDIFITIRYRELIKSNCQWRKSPAQGGSLPCPPLPSVFGR